MFVVAALYQFKDWPNFSEAKEELTLLCSKHKVKGTLLLAAEGINGTIAGPRQGIDMVKDYLVNALRFNGLEYKESFSEEMPFFRLKVRLKKEIVTLGRPEANPGKVVGTYVEPKDWNDLIQDPDIIVIDTRNDYEYMTGTFKGSINPGTKAFREFPEYVKTLDPENNKKVAMFCTGGIRCEKASSYMLNQGFKEVYHLKGGILKYLEEVPQEQSLWEGECFVFDQRVTVTHGVEVGQHDQCHGCRMPISAEDMKSKYYEKGISCPHCFDKLTKDQRRRYSERQKQIDLASSRNEVHIGRVPKKTQHQQY